MTGPRPSFGDVSSRASSASELPRQRKRMTTDHYRWAKENGYNDDELRAEGYDPPEAEGIGGKVASAAAGALEGATFGFGDEAVGALGSVLPGRTYEGTRDKIREWQKERKAANPKTYTAANVAGAVVSPASKVLMAGKAATLSGAVAKGARMGATGGALYGFGAAEGDAGDQLGSTVAGGLIGGAAGGVVPLLGAAAKSVGSNARDIAQRVRGRITGTAGQTAQGAQAAQTTAGAAGQTGQVITAQGGRSAAPPQIARGLERAGLTTDELTARLSAPRAQRAELMIADEMPEVAAAVGTLPGRGGRQVVDALTTRAQGRTARTNTAVDEALGTTGRSAKGARDALEAQRDFASSPLYEEVRALPDVVDERLDAITQASPRLRRLYREATNDVLERDRTFGVAAGSARTPPGEGLKPLVDEIKKRATPGQTERGLWPTAKTTSGGIRPLEQVDTEGLLDDLIRRNELERMYYKNTRKYGPNSAVTRRNAEQINRIQDLLVERDGIPFDGLETVLKARRTQLARELGVDQVTARDMERLVHAQPKAGALGGDVIEGAGEAAEESAEPTLHRLAVLDRFKRKIDDAIQMAEKRGANSEVEQLSGVQRELLTVTDELTEGAYARAREAYAGPSRSIDAIRGGQKAHLMRDDDMRELVQAMAPEERGAARIGVADMMRRNPRWVRKLVGDDPNVTVNRAKLREAVADDNAYQSIIEAVEAEAKGAATFTGAARGSRTAPLAAAQADLDNQAVADAASAAITGGLRGALQSAGRGIQGRARAGLTERSRNAVAEALMLRPGTPEYAALIRALLAREQTSTALARAGGRAGAGTTAVTRP